MSSSLKHFFLESSKSSPRVTCCNLLKKEFFMFFKNDTLLMWNTRHPDLIITHNTCIKIPQWVLEICPIAMYQVKKSKYKIARQKKWVCVFQAWIKFPTKTQHLWNQFQSLVNLENQVTQKQDTVEIIAIHGK